VNKLQPFAVRTKNLNENQLTELFILTEQAGATLREVNNGLLEEVGETLGEDLPACDPACYEFAGVDYDLETMFGHELGDYIDPSTSEFRLFASFEDACAYLIASQNIANQKEEEDYNFTNTKLYTKDKDLIEKYAKLCGVEYKKDVISDPVVVCFKGKNDQPLDFSYGSLIDEGYTLSGDVVTEVTPEQVEKVYAEKFGCDSKSLITHFGYGVGDWTSLDSVNLKLKLKEALKQKKEDYTIRPENPEPKLDYKLRDGEEVLSIDGTVVYCKQQEDVSITIPDGCGKGFTLSNLRNLLESCRELAEVDK